MRAVLVTVPPLLADITRHVLSRTGVSIIAEIADTAISAKRLRNLAPDVVIIGPQTDARPLSAALVRSMLPHARVLTLSADLSRILGPGEDDVHEFTPETLADCLRW
jgi:AmiR/NasT family two-component response regulator